MTKLEQIIEKLQSQQRALADLNVVSLRLFGSAARGESSAGSDADFLVRFRGTPDFDRFMDLKFLLEDTLGIRIDLVTEESLRPAMRERVERDAVRVA